MQAWACREDAGRNFSSRVEQAGEGCGGRGLVHGLQQLRQKQHQARGSQAARTGRGRGACMQSGLGALDVAFSCWLMCACCMHACMQDEHHGGDHGHHEKDHGHHAPKVKNINVSAVQARACQGLTGTSRGITCACADPALTPHVGQHHALFVCTSSG